MSALDGQVALVTGSSRGIGAAVADAIVGDGGKAVPVTGDVTDFGQVEALRQAVEESLGPVGILVANAGGSLTPPALLEEIPEDGWRATIDGNLLATFLTLKSFLPGMKERRRGSIITVSSTAGRRPHPGSPIAYAAAKAGIVLLTQDAAAQAGSFGIRVNCIAPETILTERNLQQIPAGLRTTLADAHPLKRLGPPQDVAAAAAFLASDEAAWITGVVVDVAGGAVMI